MQDFIKLGRDLGIDWNYVLTKDITFDFGTGYAIPKEYKNQWFWIRMEGESLFLTVYKNYAWDGCSLVPDFKGTIIASLPHDVIYQFSEKLSKVWGWKLSKTLKMADKLFYTAMKQNETNAIVSNIYYAGVRTFGYAFHIIARIFRKQA